MKLFLSVFLLFGLGCSAWAQYDEAVDGDLSNDPSSPTLIILSASGSTSITASSMNGEDDYFSITIPEGGSLDSLLLESLVSANVGFLSILPGATAVPESGVSTSDLLGWTHLALPIGDKLPTLQASTSTGAQGFDIPLPAGTYTFWSQETATTPTTYTIRLVTSQPRKADIPTVGEWSLLVLGLLILIVSCRWWQQSADVVSIDSRHA
ncbi:MAG: hypothetical protein AAFQ02_02770 [Bacteroidota bacterium]